MRCPLPLRHDAVQAVQRSLIPLIMFWMRESAKVCIQYLCVQWIEMSKVILCQSVLITCEWGMRFYADTKFPVGPNRRLDIVLRTNHVNKQWHSMSALNGTNLKCTTFCVRAGHHIGIWRGRPYSTKWHLQVFPRCILSEILISLCPIWEVIIVWE